MSREIIKNGDYKIELIEETEDDSRERYHILNTDCINKQIPGRTQREYYIDNRNKRNNETKKRKKYEVSWGGRIDYNNNSLLKIDPNLFILLQ